MSYSVGCLIVKKEESNIDVNEMRKEHFTVYETQNGFYLIDEFSELAHLENDGYQSRYKELLKILNDAKKDTEHKILYFSSSTFGGCLDEMTVKVYVNATLNESFQSDTYNEEGYQAMRDAFGLDCEDVFDFIGLGEIRSNSDLITEEQKQELKERQEHIEFKKYKKWIETFEGLTEGERMQRVVLLSQKKGYSERMDFVEEMKYLAMYYDLPFVTSIQF